MWKANIKANKKTFDQKGHRYQNTIIQAGKIIDNVPSLH